jgi:nucleoid DNA-binding protein
MPTKVEYVNHADIITMTANVTGEDRRDVERVIGKYNEIIQDLLSSGKSVKLAGLFRLAIVECKGVTGLNNYGQKVDKKPYRKIKPILCNALRRRMGEEFEKSKDEEED